MRPNLLTSIPQEEKKPSYDFRKWAAVTGGNEGFEKKAYLDTKGILTIGYGFNLEEPVIRKKLLSRGFDVDGMIKGKVSMTEAQALPILEEIYKESFDTTKSKFSNFDSFPDDVKHVVTDMMFNMGEGRFDGFKKMKAALLKNDYAGAAREIGDSSYANQVGNRAKRNINQLNQIASLTSASNVQPFFREDMATMPMREATSVSPSYEEPVEFSPVASDTTPAAPVEAKIDPTDTYVWTPGGKVSVKDFVNQYGEKVFESTFKTPVPKYKDGGLTLPYWKDLDKQYYINSDRTPREYKSGGWTDLDRRYGYYGQYPGYAYGSHVVHGGPTWPEYAMGLDSGATLKQTLDVLKGNPTPKILDTSAQGNMPKKAKYPSNYLQGVKKYSLPEEGRSLYEKGGMIRGITFEDGGPVNPLNEIPKLIVNNPNDPRLQAYRDSSSLYKKTMDILSPKYYNNGDPAWYNFKGTRKEANDFMRKNNIDLDYEYYRTGKFPGKIQPIETGDFGEGMAYPIYKKPVQEVVYEPLTFMQPKGLSNDTEVSPASNPYPTKMVAPTADEIMMPSGQMMSRKAFIKQYGQGTWDKATNKKADGGPTDPSNENFAIRPVTYDTPNKINIPLMGFDLPTIKFSNDQQTPRGRHIFTGYEREGFGLKSSPFVDTELNWGAIPTQKYNYTYLDPETNKIIEESPGGYNAVIKGGFKPEFALGQKSYSKTGKEKLDHKFSISPSVYTELQAGKVANYPWSDSKSNGPFQPNGTYMYVNPGAGLEVARHQDRTGMWPAKLSANVDYNRNMGTTFGLKGEAGREGGPSAELGATYNPNYGLGFNVQTKWNIGDAYEKIRRKKTPPQNTINPRYKNGGLTDPEPPVESGLATQAIRTALYPFLPTNARQLAASMITQDSNFGLQDAGEGERIALYNTLERARKRTGQNKGGTEYVDYGMDYNTDLEHLQAAPFNVLTGSALSSDFNAATTFGRVAYEYDPKTQTYKVYDSYDFAKTPNTQTAYSGFRNAVGDAAEARGISPKGKQSNYIGSMRKNEYQNRTPNPGLLDFSYSDIKKTLAPINSAINTGYDYFNKARNFLGFEDGSYVGVTLMMNTNVPAPRYNKTPNKAVMPVVYANEPNTPDWSKGAKFEDGGWLDNI